MFFKREWCFEEKIHFISELTRAIYLVQDNETSAIR